MFGRRPIETRTVSASIVSAAPPLAGSTVRVTLLPPALAPVTLVAVRISKPCFLKIFAHSLRTSPSMPGRIWSRNSTTVTFAPSRRQTEPNSSPITPPPITTIWSGTAFSSSALVESTIRSWSISTPGSGVTLEPVAMTICFAL